MLIDQCNQSIDWLIDWLIGWLIDWLIGGVGSRMNTIGFDWLIDWLGVHTRTPAKNEDKSSSTDEVLVGLIDWLIDWIDWLGGNKLTKLNKPNLN